MCSCYSSKDAESNSSCLLGWEDTQARGHHPVMLLHDLLQASPTLKPSFCLCCKARANIPPLPKIMAVFPPALLKSSYPAEALAPCSHCISSLCFRCSFSIKLASHLLDFNILSLAFSTHACENSNYAHLKIKLKSIHTEILTKKIICLSTWHRFSLMLTFILLGQESPECFLLPKSRKSAFLWSNTIISDSGDLES